MVKLISFAEYRAPKLPECTSAIGWFKFIKAAQQHQDKFIGRRKAVTFKEYASKWGCKFYKRALMAGFPPARDDERPGDDPADLELARPEGSLARVLDPRSFYPYQPTLFQYAVISLLSMHYGPALRLQLLVWNRHSFAAEYVRTFNAVTEWFIKLNGEIMKEGILEDLAHLPVAWVSFLAYCAEAENEPVPTRLLTLTNVNRYSSRSFINKNNHFLLLTHQLEIDHWDQVKEGTVDDSYVDDSSSESDEGSSSSSGGEDEDSEEEAQSTDYEKLPKTEAKKRRASPSNLPQTDKAKDARADRAKKISPSDNGDKARAPLKTKVLAAEEVRELFAAAKLAMEKEKSGKANTSKPPIKQRRSGTKKVVEVSESVKRPHPVHKAVSEERLTTEEINAYAKRLQDQGLTAKFTPEVRDMLLPERQNVKRKLRLTRDEIDAYAKKLEVQGLKPKFTPEVINELLAEREKKLQAQDDVAMDDPPIVHNEKVADGATLTVKGGSGSQGDMEMTSAMPEEQDVSRGGGYKGKVKAVKGGVPYAAADDEGCSGGGSLVDDFEGFHDDHPISNVAPKNVQLQHLDQHGFSKALPQVCGGSRLSTESKASASMMEKTIESGFEKCKSEVSSIVADGRDRRIRQISELEQSMQGLQATILALVKDRDERNASNRQYIINCSNLKPASPEVDADADADADTDTNDD